MHRHPAPAGCRVEPPPRPGPEWTLPWPSAPERASAFPRRRQIRRPLRSAPPSMHLAHLEMLGPRWGSKPGEAPCAAGGALMFFDRAAKHFIFVYLFIYLSSFFCVCVCVFHFVFHGRAPQRCRGPEHSHARKPTLLWGTGTTTTFLLARPQPCPAARGATPHCVLRSWPATTPSLPDNFHTPWHERHIRLLTVASVDGARRLYVLLLVVVLCCRGGLGTWLGLTPTGCLPVSRGGLLGVERVRGPG